MRGVAIVAIAVAGVGLFGSGVRGVAQLDGKLAGAADESAAREVKRELGSRHDCPWKERERRSERRRF